MLERCDAGGGGARGGGSSSSRFECTCWHTLAGAVPLTSPAVHVHGSASGGGEGGPAHAAEMRLACGGTPTARGGYGACVLRVRGSGGAAECVAQLHTDGAAVYDVSCCDGGACILCVMSCVVCGGFFVRVVRSDFRFNEGELGRAARTRLAWD